MNSFQEFLGMGGYAAFVWPAYALAIFGLGAIYIASKRAVSQRQAELDRLRPPRPDPRSEEAEAGLNPASRQGNGAEVRET